MSAAARRAPGTTGASAPVARRLLEGDSLDLAPLLLGKLLVHGARAGRIVEVEAYRGAADPASHAFGGRTARNASMFGCPGLLYVYFTYGMHWCANVVCGTEGEASAVLLRALEPVAGLEEMRAARASMRRNGRTPPDRDLCRGPANLARALGIGKEHDGWDLVGGPGGPTLEDDGTLPPVGRALACGPRVGITRATEHRWRFWVAGSPFVSGAPVSGAPPSMTRSGVASPSVH